MTRFTKLYGTKGDFQPPIFLCAYDGTDRCIHDEIGDCHDCEFFGEIINRLGRIEDEIDTGS